MFDVLCETLREICNRWGYEWPGGEMRRSPVIWTPPSNVV